ncbi:hypothetical protein BH10ACI2_BH10ACI2_01610 [soil metagenome]
MRYINPYLLLNIEPGGLFDTPESLKRRRREVLSQIALDGEISFQNEKIDRATAIRVLGELDDLRTRQHHAAILRNDDLHSFLSFGKCVGILNFSEGSKDFLNYLEPYLVERFSESLDQALTAVDSQMVSSLTSSKFMFEAESWEKAYRPARRYLRGISQELETKKKALKDSLALEDIIPTPCVLTDGVGLGLTNRFKDPFPVQPETIFLDSLLSLKDIECVNKLPDSFQDLRNDVANAMDGIAVTIYNDVDEEEIAQKIAERAVQVKVGTKDGDRIRENFRVISVGNNKLRIADTATQLKIIAASIRNRHIDSPDEAVSSVLTVFDSRPLNQISTTVLNTDIIELTKQMREIGWLLITSFKSVPAAILLVQECMKLKLSDPSVQSVLLQSLAETRETMLASIDSLNPPPITPPKKEPTSNTRSKNTRKVNREPPETYFSPSIIEDGGVLRSFLKAFRGSSFQNVAKAVGIMTVLTALAACIFIAGFSDSDLQVKTGTNANASPTPGRVTGGTPIATQLPIALVSPTNSPPQKIVRPATGTVLARTGGRGLGQLNVSNGLGVDAIVRLRDSNTGKTVREMYVRTRDRSTLSGIAPGDYEIVFSTGYDYSASTKTFTRSASYEKFDRIFTFTQTREASGTRYDIAEITLDKVVNGTLTSSAINSSDFNR